MRLVSRTINEAYIVKHGHGQPTKSFNTLEDAVKYINDGMETRDSDTYALYNEDKEMIWLNWYRDENNRSLGYVVQRHDDKKTVEFDKQKGLFIKAPEKENDLDLRGIVVKETGRMQYYKEARQFAQLRLVKDTSKPSYIDFEDGCIHFNTNEQLNDAIETLVKQLKEKKESIETDNLEPLEELFGFGSKKYKENRYAVGITIPDEIPGFNLTAYAKSVADIIRYNGGQDVREYIGPSECNKRRLFAHKCHRLFEFTSTEADYNRIQQQVKSIPSYKVLSDDIYYDQDRHAKIDKQLPNVSSFMLVANGVKHTWEAVEESADNWYKMNW